MRRAFEERVTGEAGIPNALGTPRPLRGESPQDQWEDLQDMLQRQEEERERLEERRTEIERQMQSVDPYSAEYRLKEEELAGIQKDYSKVLKLEVDCRKTIGELEIEMEKKNSEDFTASTIH